MTECSCREFRCGWCGRAKGEVKLNLLVQLYTKLRQD